MNKPTAKEYAQAVREIALIPTVIFVVSLITGVWRLLYALAHDFSVSAAFGIGTGWIGSWVLAMVCFAYMLQYQEPVNIRAAELSKLRQRQSRSNSR